MPGVIVLTGGGIKGAVAAARYAKDHAITLLHVDYGQTSGLAELAAIRQLGESIPSSRVIGLTLPHLRQLQHSLAGPNRNASSEGQKANEELSPALLHGVVMNLFVTAAQCGVRSGAFLITTGLMQSANAAHLGLAPGTFSRDDRRELLHVFNILTEVLGGVKTPLRVEAPLMDLSHAEVIKLGLRLGAPLAKTWTCLRAQPIPCGSCAPCRERANGFRDAGVVDPAFEELSAAVVGATAGHGTS